MSFFVVPRGCFWIGSDGPALAFGLQIHHVDVLAVPGIALPLIFLPHTDKSNENIRLLFLVHAAPSKFLVRIRQNFVPGVSDCSIALDIGIDQPMQVSIILFQLFQVSIGLAAGKHCRKHKRGMVQKIILLPNWQKLRKKSENCLQFAHEAVRHVGGKKLSVRIRQEIFAFLRQVCYTILVT